MTHRKLIAFAASLVLTLCGIAVAHQGIGWHFDMMRNRSYGPTTDTTVKFIYQVYDAGYVVKYASSNLAVISTNYVASDAAYRIASYGDRIYIGSEFVGPDGVVLYTNSLANYLINTNTGATSVRYGFTATEDSVYTGGFPIHRLDGYTLNSSASYDGISVYALKVYNGYLYSANSAGFVNRFSLNGSSTNISSDLGTFANTENNFVKTAIDGTSVLACCVGTTNIYMLDPVSLTTLFTKTASFTRTMCVANSSNILLTSSGSQGFEIRDIATWSQLCATSAAPLVIYGLACDETGFYLSGTSSQPVRKYNSTGIYVATGAYTRASLSRGLCTGF